MTDVLDRRALIVLAILGVLVLVYLLVTDAAAPPPRVDQPFEMESVGTLERVELSPPAGTDRPELIVLERREDHWWMLRPVEAPVDERVAAQFQALFETRTAADDLRFDPDRRSEFGLDEDEAVHLVAFAVGDNHASHELWVGTEMQVPQTGARRTFVRPRREDSIYRLQAGIGQLVRMPTEELIAGREESF